MLVRSSNLTGGGGADFNKFAHQLHHQPHQMQHFSMLNEMHQPSNEYHRESNYHSPISSTLSSSSSTNSSSLINNLGIPLIQETHCDLNMTHLQQMDDDDYVDHDAEDSDADSDDEEDSDDDNDEEDSDEDEDDEDSDSNVDTNKGNKKCKSASKKLVKKGKKSKQDDRKELVDSSNQGHSINMFDVKLNKKINEENFVTISQKDEQTLQMINGNYYFLIKSNSQ